MKDRKNLAIGLGVAAGAAGLIYLATRAEAVECVIDADCPPGYKCVNGKCVPEEEPERANLYGVVIDAETDAPVEAVKITLDGIAAFTNNLGEYLFQSLAPGSYSITFIKEGYETAEGDITLTEGNNELNVGLTPTEMINYYCPYCLVALSSLDEFFNHLESVHFYIPEDYFYCPYCGDEFSTLQAFFSHLEAEHIDDITAPPTLPPDYLQNLSLYPTIVRQGEDATISGYFTGPFPDAYTKYRLAFNYYRLEYPGPRAYGNITSAGLFSLTLPTVDRHQHLIPPGTYPIYTTCAKRHDPPGGPILEGTIWLNVNTGLTITILTA